MVEEPVDLNPNLLSSTYHKTRHAGCHIIKLNRIKDKQARYEPHERFLIQCLEAKIVPKVFVFDVEPTIGNHGQEF